MPGCICSQHLSALRQRRPRGHGSRGAGRSSPSKTTTQPSRRRAARGRPGSPKLHLGESTWIAAGARLPGRWGLGRRGRGGRYGEPALGAFIERSCASLTGNSSPVPPSSGELGFGCSGPVDRCPLTPHSESNARRVEKVLFSARVAGRKNRGRGEEGEGEGERRGREGGGWGRTRTREGRGREGGERTGEPEGRGVGERRREAVSGFCLNVGLCCVNKFKVERARLGVVVKRRKALAV